jgi:hypothetical protein
MPEKSRIFSAPGSPMRKLPEGAQGGPRRRLPQGPQVAAEVRERDRGGPLQLGHATVGEDAAARGHRAQSL